MDSFLYTKIFLIVLGILFLSSSIRILKENERIVVFRLGKFLSIKGPGLVLVVPVVDRVVRVNLSEKVPGWQGLSKMELDEKIKSLSELNNQ